jgi:ABC-type antimicrobial peptide transport system permease subunit
MITGVGLAAGAALAVVLNRVMVSALFGLVSFDATAVAVMTAAIGITVIVAGWLPASRAASLEPTEALRMP